MLKKIHTSKIWFSLVSVKDSSPGCVVQSMCKYSTGEVAAKLSSWKWWDGAPRALSCSLLPEQLWTGISHPLSSSGCCISQNLPLSNKPACPLELKTRAFSLAVIQELSSTHFIPSPGPGQPTILKHTFLQLLGFVKLKSMFAKPLQLLGWKVVSQFKYHLINKEVSCRLQRRTRGGL